jgi:hypothetical protein
MIIEKVFENNKNNILLYLLFIRCRWELEHMALKSADQQKK